MSVAYYIVPEREIPDFDHHVDGVALAHAPEGALDALCERLGVRPLMGFFSMDPEEAAEFMEEEAEPPEEQWFPAADGLKTVRALLAHPDELPVQGSDGVSRYGETDDESGAFAELRAFEGVLVRLEQEGVGWHLGVDY